jgi:hypothetical protein
MFIDGALTYVSPLRPDKFNFLSKNPTTFEASENELDYIEGIPFSTGPSRWPTFAILSIRNGNLIDQYDRLIVLYK